MPSAETTSEPVVNVRWRNIQVLRGIGLPERIADQAAGWAATRGVKVKLASPPDDHPCIVVISGTGQRRTAGATIYVDHLRLRRPRLAVLRAIRQAHRAQRRPGQWHKIIQV